MKVKLNPSERTKKRYLLIEAGNKGKEEIEKIILDYIGILGWAKAKPSFISNVDNDKGIVLQVDRGAVNDMRASFELCKEKIIVKRISGTLKGLGIN